MDTSIVTTNTEAETWAQAFLAWQSSLAKNTQRGYQVAWQSLLASADSMPWSMTRADVARWADGLRIQDQAPATIRQRLAAISSFYRFAGTDYTIRRDGQAEAPLFAGANPAGGKSLRPKQAPFQGASYLGVAECQALLRAIRTGRGVQAERDYALFLAYLMLGRRNTEIRLLTWGDIQAQDGKTWYRWSGKGREDQRTELPAICYQAIVDYLKAAGRLAGMKAEHYIFGAINANARRLPGGESWQAGGALSARQVGKLLKKYCALAGLDPARVHVHTLRHSAAMLRKAAGDDIKQISDFLVHSSLGTTQIYLHTLEGSGDSSWGKVAELLGLAGEAKPTIPPEKRRHHKRR